jgi:hypothetical protein
MARSIAKINPGIGPGGGELTVLLQDMNTSINELASALADLAARFNALGTDNGGLRTQYTALLADVAAMRTNLTSHLANGVHTLAATAGAVTNPPAATALALTATTSGTPALAQLNGAAVAVSGSATNLSPNRVVNV